jgi:hypothetical protein
VGASIAAIGNPETILKSQIETLAIRAVGDIGKETSPIPSGLS